MLKVDNTSKHCEELPRCCDKCEENSSEVFDRVEDEHLPNAAEQRNDKQVSCALRVAHTEVNEGKELTHHDGVE